MGVADATSADAEQEWDWRLERGGHGRQHSDRWPARIEGL